MSAEDARRGRTEGQRQVEAGRSLGRGNARGHWFSVGAAPPSGSSPTPWGGCSFRKLSNHGSVHLGFLRGSVSLSCLSEEPSPGAYHSAGVERPQGSKGTNGVCTAGMPGWGQRTGLLDTPSLCSCRRSPSLQRPRPGLSGPPSSTCRHRCSQPGPQRPDLTPHPGPCPTQLRDLPQIS